MLEKRGEELIFLGLRWRNSFILFVTIVLVWAMFFFPLFFPSSTFIPLNCIRLLLWKGRTTSGWVLWKTHPPRIAFITIRLLLGKTHPLNPFPFSKPFPFLNLSSATDCFYSPCCHEGEKEIPPKTTPPTASTTISLQALKEGYDALIKFYDDENSKLDTVVEAIKCGHQTALPPCTSADLIAKAKIRIAEEMKQARAGRGSSDEIPKEIMSRSGKFCTTFSTPSVEETVVTYTISSISVSAVAQVQEQTASAAIQNPERSEKGTDNWGCDWLD